MYPAYYHQHLDNRDYPGDLDVHGAHPRPRAHQFEGEPGRALTAYANPDTEATLADPNALYTQEFGQLARDSAAVDFKLVDRAHWFYETLSNDGDEYLLWWRRRNHAHRNRDSVFPWYPVSMRDEFTLFDRNSMLPVVRAQLVAYDQDRGRAATGWAAVRFITPIERVPGIMAELARVNGR